MARGQAQAADRQLGKTNAIGDAQLNQSQKLEGQLVPGYTSLMDTGYLSPQEEEAAQNNGMGAATEPFHSAETRATNRAAATRNPADLTSEETQLALDEGRTAGSEANQLQTEKMNNQEAGMYGLTNLQAGNQKFAEDMYGLGPGTLSARAAGPSGDQLGIGYINAATGAVSALKGK